MTRSDWNCFCCCWYFYSHIPCGMWQYAYDVIKKGEKFLLTHPVWDVTEKQQSFPSLLKFLLTHPVWDVTMCRNSVHINVKISTHTSRVGCDILILDPQNEFKISTHTSRVGCDKIKLRFLPMYGISTHTSRVGCDKQLVIPNEQVFEISTHTSRVGCDLMW